MTQMSDFVSKNHKKRKEGIVPWVAPEQGAFRHRCEDTRRSAFRKVATYGNMSTKKFSNL
jgi:hypothetical protein